MVVVVVVHHMADCLCLLLARFIQTLGLSVSSPGAFRFAATVYNAREHQLSHYFKHLKVSSYHIKFHLQQ